MFEGEGKERNMSWQASVSAPSRLQPPSSLLPTLGFLLGIRDSGDTHTFVYGSNFNSHLGRSRMAMPPAIRI